MERLHSLRRRRWAWASGLGALLTGAGIGCFPQASVPLVPANSPPKPVKEVVKEKDQPKRPPEASTCVAFGNLELEAAGARDRSAADRRELFDRARKYFQQAIKEDPRNTEAYQGLVQAYEGLGDYEHTVETYQKAKKALPKNAAFCFGLGMCQARHQDWAPALDNLKAATELDPENRKYANTRAFALARTGRYQEGFECFKKMVGEAQAHYNVARMLHHLKQDDVCKDELREALKADPTLADARQFLADLEGGTEPKGSGPTAAGFAEPDGESPSPDKSPAGEEPAPERVHGGIQ
jgi:tetratricopeptide (TPR) repeat protein